MTPPSVQCAGPGPTDPERHPVVDGGRVRPVVGEGGQRTASSTTGLTAPRWPGEGCTETMLGGQLTAAAAHCRGDEQGDGERATHSKVPAPDENTPPPGCASRGRWTSLTDPRSPM